MLTSGTETTTFTPDALGRITSVDAPYTGVVGYSYDGAGRRTQISYPNSGPVIDYEYWLDNQLKKVSQGSTTLANYSYDSAGRLYQTTRANGATTTATYDAADRLRDLSTIVGTTTTARFEYDVDRLGQRRHVTETLTLSPTQVLTYTYDGLQRLAGVVESSGATYAYAYDLAGNRTSVTRNSTLIESRSYDAANQVNGWTYDAAGNLVSDGSATYSYDALNRLTQQGGVSYAYNGDGTLVSQAAGGVTTRYTQDLVAPLSQVLQITQGSGTPTNYVYGVERMFAVSSGARLWYLNDALGSVRQLSDDAGTIVNAYSYEPWGNPQQSLNTPFGFTGELQEENSKLVYMRARWYNSKSGTFISRDPFSGINSMPYSMHPYQYGYSNPVYNTDPSGKMVSSYSNESISMNAGYTTVRNQYGRDNKNYTARCSGYQTSAEPPEVQDVGLDVYVIAGDYTYTVAKGQPGKVYALVDGNLVRGDNKAGLLYHVVSGSLERLMEVCHKKTQCKYVFERDFRFTRFATAADAVSTAIPTAWKTFAIGVVASISSVVVGCLVLAGVVGALTTFGIVVTLPATFFECIASSLPIEIGGVILAGVTGLAYFSYIYISYRGELEPGFNSLPYSQKPTVYI